MNAARRPAALALTLALAIVPAVAAAGESEDVKGIPMQPPGTVVVVDAGKAPRRNLLFHFAPSAKRTVRTETEKVVKMFLKGETQRQRQPLSTEETTYQVKSVAEDGHARLELSSGGTTATVEITPQGHMSITSPNAPPALAAAMSQIPAVLPTEQLSQGARWHIFQRIDMLGMPTDSVTVVTLVSSDGDKVVLHMIQDFHLDAKGLAAKMGVTGMKIERANNQNVADVTLDLASPAVMTGARVISALETVGTVDGRRVEAMFLKTVSTEEIGKPRAAETPAGKWTQAWAGLTMTTVYRADGTATLNPGQHPTEIRWRVDGADRMTVSDGKQAAGVESHVVVAGDYMADWFDGGEILWRRAQ